jgi:hypothetical protein
MEERERVDEDWDGAASERRERRRRQEEDKVPVIRKQRRKGNGFPQGPMSKYRNYKDLSVK